MNPAIVRALASGREVLLGIEPPTDEPPIKLRCVVKGYDDAGRVSVTLLPSGRPWSVYHEFVSSVEEVG